MNFENRPLQAMFLWLV